MKSHLWVLASVVMFASVSDLRADVVTTYDISFNSLITGALLPTAGTFTYDSTTQMFTDFRVNWDNYTWDLRGAANNPLIEGAPVACIGGTTGAAASFELLTVCNNGAPDDWAGSTTSGNNYFFFADPNGAFVPGSVYILASGSASLGQLAVGTYSVSVATVATPEPSSLPLLGSALIVILSTTLFRKWKPSSRRPKLRFTIR